MKFTENIGLNTWFCIIFHDDFSALIVVCLTLTKVLQLLIHICVKSYKISLGLRNHVQNSTFRVLTGAKDAETYFTDEFRDENK